VRDDFRIFNEVLLEKLYQETGETATVLNFHHKIPAPLEEERRGRH
jgi:hypothetical protein